MSYLGDKDFLLEVRKGNVAGHAIEYKFGRNDAVSNGLFELISQLSGATAFRTTASTVRIKAGGDAADTAAGAGAREITVAGIADDLTETQEAIATAGASASSATSTSFWRVYRAWVSAFGARATTPAANTGNVVIEDSGAVADMIMIVANEGQSQYGAYAVPTGKTGYLLNAHVTADASKAADFRVFTREGLNDVAAPFAAQRLQLYADGVLGHADIYDPPAPGIVIPALTDIWFEAEGGGASTEVSCNFEILLVDN